MVGRWKEKEHMPLSENSGMSRVPGKIAVKIILDAIKFLRKSLATSENNGPPRPSAGSMKIIRWISCRDLLNRRCWRNL